MFAVIICNLCFSRAGKRWLCIVQRQSQEVDYELWPKIIKYARYKSL